MDLAQIQQLITDGAASTTANTVLKDRMAEAMALRDAPMAQNKQTGFVDPFSAIASVIRQSRGRRDLRENRPQYEQSIRDVNDTAAASKNYGLGLAAAKVKQDQLNVENKAAATVKSAKTLAGVNKAAALKKAIALKEQQDIEQDNWTDTFFATEDQNMLKQQNLVEQRDQEQDNWTDTFFGTEDQNILKQENLEAKNKLAQENLEAKNKLAQENLEAQGKVIHLQNANDPTQRARGIDRQGTVTIDGEPAGSEWTKIPPPKGKAGVTTKGNSYPKIPFSELKARDTYTRTAKSMRELNLEFMPEFGNESGLPLLGQIDLAIASKAPAFSNSKSKERQAWWSKFKLQYEMAARNDMFGSALTGTEAGEWLAANINPDMEGAQIAKKLAELQYMMDEEQAARGESATATGQYPPAFIEKHYGSAMRAKEARIAKEDALLSTLSLEHRKEYRSGSLFFKNQILDAAEARAAEGVE